MMRHHGGRTRAPGTSQAASLYIALGETDEWAHERRYDLYLQSVRDHRFLADLWQTVQGLPEYRDKTSLIVTTDHGRGEKPDDWIDHDRDVVGAEFVWIAVMVR